MEKALGKRVITGRAKPRRVRKNEKLTKKKKAGRWWWLEGGLFEEREMW